MPLKNLKPLSGLSISEKASYLRDSIYAANDGIITTFAVVAGAEGAGLPFQYILIFGFANLFADALSMASGVYLGVKSEQEYKGGRLLSGAIRKVFNNSPPADQPIYHSYVTFASFIIGGLIPLIPYLTIPAQSFNLAIVFLAVSMILLGILRGRFTERKTAAVVLETFLVGAAAAVIAYTVGAIADFYFI